MRVRFVFILLMFVTALKAQTTIQDHFLNNAYAQQTFAHHIPFYDSSLNKKWSFSKYVGMSAGYSFFKGGSVSVIAVPIGLQLNRRLTDNVYAFTGVSVAPAYLNGNGFFLPGGNKFNANNTFSTSGSFGIYSKAELGLMYINDVKTFSISGSIGIEKSSTPVFYNGAYTARPGMLTSPNK